MPTYVYQVITPAAADPEGETGEIFEVVQSMQDPPLTHHPETGLPVRRLIQPPNIGGAWSESRTKDTAANNQRLGELGFTKYVKKGDGHYEKAAGKGPNEIQRD